MKKNRVKYANAIGNFIISFSEIEEGVNNVLSSLINERSHYPGYRIIKYLNFRTKINLLKDEWVSYVKIASKEEKKKELLEEIEIIYNKLREISEFRNKVAHANWVTLDKGGFVTCKIKEDKNEFGMLQFEKIKITPGIILKFLRQMSAISSKLGEYPERLWDNSR